MAKTLEQIQAELETLKRQFTDFSAVSPVSYYVHQYSGEEIDAAVGAVPTLVRPNLLDNWYFGNPVDQRKGYIVPAGVQYAKVDGFVPQGPIPETVRVDYIDSDGSARFNYGGAACFVPKGGGYVRGYTGQFVYAIDRWILDGEQSNVMEITDGGIHVSYTKPAWNVIQKFKNVLRKGNTYTFSAVYKSTLPVRLVVTWGDGKYFYNESSPATSEWALVTITGTVPNNAEIAYEQVAFQPLGSVAGTLDIKAVKLELGPTQTLAHQENGQWVLNEVPDYGEQLRRCQRYAFSPLYEAYATAVICNLFVSSVANGVAFGEVTLPVSMRHKPVFSGNASNLWIVAENGGGASRPTAVAVMGLSADKVMIQVNGSYAANTQYILYVENPFTSADFLLSADL